VAVNFIGVGTKKCLANLLTSSMSLTYFITLDCIYPIALLIAVKVANVSGDTNTPMLFHLTYHNGHGVVRVAYAPF